eukprot:GEZU01043033.1.p1 GENE.GEZU01043033.1~~GEZU01043033.1.p1  ORF type:complete len:111 (+),score=24.05 GEZU01043033.1:68-400(+)
MKRKAKPAFNIYAIPTPEDLIKPPTSNNNEDKENSNNNVAQLSPKAKQLIETIADEQGKKFTSESVQELVKLYNSDPEKAQKYLAKVTHNSYTWSPKPDSQLLIMRSICP